MSSKLVANQALMKQQNRARVIYTLWKNSPISRTGLAKMTGLNKATITNIILSLQEENMVVHKGSLHGSVGRAQKLLMFNENYGLCAGIMIRAKKLTWLSAMCTQKYYGAPMCLFLQKNHPWM